jgi:hypothetical protein
VNVAQLLHKLRVITNIEIVVPLLPEMLRIANLSDGWPIQARRWLEWGSSGERAFRSLGWKQAPRYSLLQRLQRIGQRIPLRFAEQEMDIFRHDDVSVNLKSETPAHPF